MNIPGHQHARNRWLEVYPEQYSNIEEAEKVNYFGIACFIAGPV